MTTNPAICKMAILQEARSGDQCMTSRFRHPEKGQVMARWGSGVEPTAESERTLSL
jgi:hypothetical protein